MSGYPAVGKPLRSYPTLVGEVVRSEYQDDVEQLRAFPFRSWAVNNRFNYPDAAADFLAGCGSAAEAHFLRAFCARAGVAYGDSSAQCGSLSVRIQVRCAPYRIDAVVSDSENELAIEVDGLVFHHRSGEQIAADYLRERRIVARGYTVIRFTAREVITAADECWRQVEAILAARRAS